MGDLPNNPLFRISNFVAMAIIGSGASPDAQTGRNSLVAKIGDEARAELLATKGTVRIYELERLTDSQLKT